MESIPTARKIELIPIGCLLRTAIATYSAVDDQKFPLDQSTKFNLYYSLRCPQRVLRMIKTVLQS